MNYYKVNGSVDDLRFNETVLAANEEQAKQISISANSQFGDVVTIESVIFERKAIRRKILASTDNSSIGKTTWV